MNTLLSQSNSTTMKLVLEYAKLATRTSLTDAEADRLGEILQTANDSPVLNFWIAEVDHVISHRLNLLNEDDRESYKDQQVMMREYGIPNHAICPNLDSQALQLAITELDTSTPVH